MKRIAGMCMIGLMLTVGVVVAADGQALVESTCTKCHDLGRVKAAFGVKDKAAWTVTVNRMLGKSGALAVGHEDHTVLIDWLSTQKK